MIIFPSLMLSMLITVGMIPVLMNLAWKYHAVDTPNARKIHRSPIPRVGGVAMAMGAMATVLLWAIQNPLNAFAVSVIYSSVVIVVFGFIDDIKGLNYKAKVLGQIIAALIVMIYGDISVRGLGDLLPEAYRLPEWISNPLTLLVIVGVTNAINLSDGLDGLAGGISMLIFICIGFTAFQCGMITVTIISVAVTGAIFGFLRFNTHPAVIFMGDAGSQLLGFLAVTSSLHISQAHTPLNRMFPLMLLGFPILDTLVVMLERMYKGVSPFKADKNHFHHKLMRIGMRHDWAVVTIYSLQFGLVMSAFLLRYHSEWLSLVLYVGFCSLVLAFFYEAHAHGWHVNKNDYENTSRFWERMNRTKRKILIQGCFRILETGTPLLLLVTCFTMDETPEVLGYVAMAILIFLVAIKFLHESSMLAAIRTTLFIVTPYLVFVSHMNISQTEGARLITIYNFSYAFIAIIAVMTLKFTRRRKGFKANPFDFLIIFTAFMVTNIPDIENLVEDVSMITAKIIALLFAFEVLIGESRGYVRKTSCFVMISLGVLCIKSF